MSFTGGGFDVMGTSNSMCCVRQCSLCRSNTEFFCSTCGYNLCLICKEIHLLDLDALDHKIMLYRFKTVQHTEEDMCKKHPDNFVKYYCKKCKVHICDDCTECCLFPHSKINTELLRLQTNSKIRIINTEALFYCRALLTHIKKNDAKIPEIEISIIRSEMQKKGNELKYAIDNVLDDLCNIQKRKLLREIYKKKKKLIRYIASLQSYERRYELLCSTKLALIFCKKSKLLGNKDNPLIKKQGQLFPCGQLEIKAGFVLLNEIHLSVRGKRVFTQECLLQTFPKPLLKRTFEVKGINACFHISCGKQNKFYVSSQNRLILTNIEGDTLNVRDITSHGEINSSIGGFGIHAIDKNQDIVYINKEFDIVSGSHNIRLKKKIDWIPQCVHCSLTTGDILVGVWNCKANTAQVVRYYSGREMSISHYNGQKLYSRPLYITENKNGDIVVSDPIYGGVVVTDRGGNRSFFYTGHSTKFCPRGICTDALSNILVCNTFEHKIEILNKEGKFLLDLLTEEYGIRLPFSLGYNVCSHEFFVGSKENNVVSVFRFLTRQNILED